MNAVVILWGIGFFGNSFACLVNAANHKPGATIIYAIVALLCGFLMVATWQ